MPYRAWCLQELCKDLADVEAADEAAYARLRAILDQHGCLSLLTVARTLPRVNGEQSVAPPYCEPGWPRARAAESPLLAPVLGSSPKWPEARLYWVLAGELAPHALAAAAAIVVLVAVLVSLWGKLKLWCAGEQHEL